MFVISEYVISIGLLSVYAFDMNFCQDFAKSAGYIQDSFKLNFLLFLFNVYYKFLLIFLHFL